MCNVFDGRVKALTILCVSLLAAHRCALSFVVAGASGGGNTNNNTTAAQLATELGLSNAAFLNNVLAYSDASAVYFGWGNTSNGARAYALSAMHINFVDSMVINGVVYSVSRQSIGGSDLALLTLTQTSGIMPPLPVTNLGTYKPSNNMDVIMAGRGRQRIQDAATTNSSDAVTWTSNGTSYSGYTTNSTQVIRWGTNTVAGSTTVNVGTGNTTATYTVFDKPQKNQFLTTNEAQGVAGDSGGGMFDLSGNLLGITLAVSNDNNASNGGTQAYFGQNTYFTDISTYKTAIDSAIGIAMIPEPKIVALWLMGIAACLLTSRRRGRAFRKRIGRNGLGIRLD